MITEESELFLDVIQHELNKSYVMLNYLDHVFTIDLV